MAATRPVQQRTEKHLRHDKKIATFEEEAVSHQGMEMKMPSGAVAKRLDGDDYTRYARLLTKSIAEKTDRHVTVHWLGLPSRALV
jgi:hypothetical protein